MNYDDALTDCDVRNTPIRETSHALNGDGDGRWLRALSWLLAKGAIGSDCPLLKIPAVDSPQSAVTAALAKSLHSAHRNRPKGLRESEIAGGL
jgi:hypothetical protein